MSFPSSQTDDDDEQVRKAQQGDAEALAALHDKCHSSLVSILLARGANPTEADDVLADLWSDCVPSAPEKASLLAKFGGKFSVLSWLARVASNRWIDLKRRGAKFAGREEIDFDDLPGNPTALEDDLLLNLLRDSLRSGFALCPGEAMIMLRLVYMHGLTQREVGRMLGWTESKTSRTLSLSMELIK
jgi:RNA polymerase sigma factor (sigma-70 family)